MSGACRLRRVRRHLAASACVLVTLVVLLVVLLAPAASAVAATPAAVPAPATHVAPGLQARLDAHPGAQVPVILAMRPAPGALGNTRAATDALARLRRHGRALNALPIIGGAAGVLPAAAIQALANDPAVAFIHEDVTVHRKDAATNLATAYPVAVGATQVRQQGNTGQGVTVAVLDSGIALDQDLVQPTNRVLAQVNFADPLGTNPDPGGHGTHVAGIIAGNGSRSNGQFIGMAPGANLVDVRVLDATGRGSLSSVIAGIQWVVAHKTAYNIRVLNLSLGAPPATTAGWVTDPLAAAAEVAWLRGITVITAAGNNGAGQVDSPGQDPYVITVGATDDQGTTPTGDDVLPSFSGWGVPPTGAKPDLVAPGRRIVSLRVPGSTLDTLLPTHVVAAANGATYLRLTGTSMATAVVSGGVALLLQHQPLLHPAQVKAVLRRTTQPFGQTSGVLVPSPTAAGSGLLSVRAAVAASADVADRGLRPTDDAARALYPVLYGGPLLWKDPNYLGINWSALTWATLTWDTNAWNNFRWDDVGWDDVGWDSVQWTDVGWDAVSWSDVGWDTFASADLD